MKEITKNFLVILDFINKIAGNKKKVIEIKLKAKSPTLFNNWIISVDQEKL